MSPGSPSLSGNPVTVSRCKYLFESDPALLADTAEALALLLPADVDSGCGAGVGWCPDRDNGSQVSGIPTRFVRKHAKEYGTCRLVEGGEIDGLRLAVIEDVVTSGGQVVESCEALRAAGATSEATACHEHA